MAECKVVTFTIESNRQARIDGKPLIPRGLAQPKNEHRLACAFLDEALGDFFAASAYCHAFDEEVLSRWRPGQTIEVDEIVEWHSWKCSPQFVKFPRLLHPDRFN